MESGQALLIGGFILRIVGAYVCSSKATELNRGSGGWGVFGFFFPIVAMIWINCMKPLTKWENIDDNDSITISSNKFK